MIDLTKLSDAEIGALSRGDVKGLSDNTLSLLAAEAPSPPEQSIWQQAKNIGSDVRNFVSGTTGPMPQGADPERWKRYQEVSQTFQNTRPIRALDAIAKTGKFANEGNQQLAGLVSESGGAPGKIVGKGYGMLSNAILPQDRVQALMSMAFGANDVENAVNKTASAGKLAKASYGQQAGGDLISSLSAVPKRYADAVVANPGILSSQTPSIAEMGTKYKEAFKKAGMVIDDNTYKSLIGNPFPPTERELGKLRSVVLEANEKLTAGTLPENEAFVARSAAAKLQQKPEWAKTAGVFKDKFDDLLENSTLPDIRGLSREYFTAVAKERFQSLFPQNKNLSPNALRGLIMLSQLLQGGKAALSGDLGEAATKIGTGLAMSPKMVGYGVRAAPLISQAALLKGGKSLTAALGDTNEPGR